MIIQGIPFFVVLVPFAIGLIVCLLAGTVVGCYAFGKAVDRLVESLGLGREILTFAIRRQRKRNGLPATIFADDCRETLENLLDLVEWGSYPNGSLPKHTAAVTEARRLLKKEIPA
jgi:hypothetical protein